MTQAQLAEKANISLRMLQRLEYGETFAGSPTIDKLSAALGVATAEFFVTQQSLSMRAVSEGAQILSGIAQLPHDLQKIILAISLRDRTLLEGLPKETLSILERLLSGLGLNLQL